MSYLFPLAFLTLKSAFWDTSRYRFHPLTFAQSKQQRSRCTLQLIPGIAATENNGIIVRGAGGRWNEIALDGIPIPNYDPAYSIFSFDMLPVSLVDNIRLLKSSTPNIPVSFGNTMTDIITKDVPE